MKTKFFILILGISWNFFAQNKTVQGEVKDLFGNPLAEAYVYNERAKSHTHTQENGYFSISNITVGDTLTIRLLGYKINKRVIKSEDLVTKLHITLEDKVFQLDELVVKQEVNPIELITKLDMKINPVNSSQEILRRVPGLFIGQHAGGGKAEQIFLRGFDVDHGTDVAISVDGMPVNMVSHAHGQGYADLHFLIPETIDRIKFGKGAYNAEQGNFNTAGFVSFQTKNRFKENKLKVEVGDFNTLRTVGLFNLIENSGNNNAVLAFEYLESDGPFESPQNFNRINVQGKFNTRLTGNQNLSFSGSHFTSRWDASGQIPQRAVDQGLISRFGAIDDTEGGTTERTNFNVSYNKLIADNTSFNTNAYYSKYDFELFSNFTFFLNDPENGDQIRQKEERDILGFQSQLNTRMYVDDVEIDIDAGVGLRNDQIIGNELSRTRNRTETLENVSLGDVNETNVFGYVSSAFDFGKFEIVPAARLDYFKFIYEDYLASSTTIKSERKTRISPKVSVSYNPNQNTEFFVKSGIGFHSNDTRVVVAQQGQEILPRSYNLDIGSNWKPLPGLFLNTTAWYLTLDQEFVYVGDEGIVEPSGKTRRLGADLSARYQLTDWLFLDSDITYSYARSIDAPEGQDYIPLAPKFTATAGIQVKDYKNFSGSIKVRHLGDRAANEDNSIVAEGYTITDLSCTYKFKNFDVAVTIENLFDVDWKETQFATESRLSDETQSVEEIHFTPGTPFFIKAGITYNF